MCLYTEYMRNPKYKSTKKNGGVIPAITDNRVTYVPIGCKRCVECMKERARNWGTRLQSDIKENRNGKFVTLTFSDKSYAELAEEFPKLEGYVLDNAIATRAMRLFLERWRKKFKKSVRHFMVTELGHNGTENIHLHGIIWTDETEETIREKWKYGFIWAGNKIYGKRKENYVNEKTVNYIMKYITKIDVKHKQYISAILTSDGIGANYAKRIDAERHKYRTGGKTDEQYKTRQGQRRGLPIYWRNKFFSEEEREKLWLEKLDKMERWVLGERVDISKGLEEYEIAVKWARKQNQKLGYGGEPLEWEEAEREKAQRRILQETRIQRARKNALPDVEATPGVGRMSAGYQPLTDPQAGTPVKIGEEGCTAERTLRRPPESGGNTNTNTKYKRVLINNNWYEIREDGIRAVK